MVAGIRTIMVTGILFVALQLTCLLDLYIMTASLSHRIQMQLHEADAESDETQFEDI